MDSYEKSFIFILVISSCAGLAHSCVCSKNLKHCEKIYQTSVDFQTAQEMCKEQGGQLSVLSNSTASEVVKFLLDNTIGNFWIGLRNHGGKCSNNTSNTTMEFTNWETEEMPCDPLCASVSKDRRLTVRPCTDTLDGFLCEDSQGDLCKGNAVVLDNDQCMSAPCEHRCTPVQGGYKCACLERFRPRARDPRRCDLYCSSSVCEAFCMRSRTVCWCPDGFVRDEQNCVDIDECDSNHGCSQMCLNTLGSYRCGCFPPFTLVNETKCTLSPDLFDDEDFSTPSPNFIARGAMSTPGEYVGLIITLVVAVFAVLILVRYLRGRKASVQETLAEHDECQESASK